MSVKQKTLGKIKGNKKLEQTGIQKYLCEDTSSEEEDEFDNEEDDAFRAMDKTIVNSEST